MDPREFLELAGEWATGTREGEWRSAISRGYYAAFHAARQVLARAGFQPPDGDRAHGYLWLRLQNSGHPDVVNAGKALNDLRRWRNSADYDLDVPCTDAEAVAAFNAADDVVRTLLDLEGEPTILAQVVTAIRDYERDVLAEVTYHGP